MRKEPYLSSSGIRVYAQMYPTTIGDEPPRTVTTYAPCMQLLSNDELALVATTQLVVPFRTVTITNTDMLTCKWYDFGDRELAKNTFLFAWPLGCYIYRTRTYKCPQAHHNHSLHTSHLHRLHRHRAKNPIKSHHLRKELELLTCA